jgi:hypothetical protein
MTLLTQLNPAVQGLSMPTDEEIHQILADKGLSDWFRTALLSALDCDPVQAAQDAGLLSIVLDRRAQAIAAHLIAAEAIDGAKRQYP